MMFVKPNSSFPTKACKGRKKHYAPSALLEMFECRTDGSVEFANEDKNGHIRKQEGVLLKYQVYLL